MQGYRVNCTKTMGQQEEKTNITLPEGTNEVIIRYGDAAPVKEAQAIVVSGAINAPSAFHAIRPGVKDKSLVRFSRKNLDIVFMANPEDEDAAVITGKLLTNPDLEKFKINKGEDALWTIGGLASFIKQNRIFLGDSDEAVAKLISELKAYKGKVTIDLEQNKNDRGASKSSIETKVDNNVPVDFKVKLPLFVGYTEKTFRVEICFDHTEGGVKLWLESAELQELFFKERDRILDEEIKKFAGLIVIEQ